MNKNLLMGAIFGGIGLIFTLIGGFFGYGSYRLYKTGVPITGTVIQNIVSDDSYKPLIEFTDDAGQTHTHIPSMSVSPSIYTSGDQVKLLYDPTDPDSVLILHFVYAWLFPLVFGGIGIIFVCIGGLCLYFWQRSRYYKTWLKKNGRLVYAKPTSVVLDTSIAIMGRSPYMIQAQLHDATKNLVHTFTSDHIWFDPSSFIKDKETIPVRMHPKNPKIYSMDISFLPKKV